MLGELAGERDRRRNRFRRRLASQHSTAHERQRRVPYGAGARRLRGAASAPPGRTRRSAAWWWAPSGEIVGRGVTAPGGRPHAEAVALDRAGRAPLPTQLIYVTLEPCAHEGRGAACADAIAAAAPARVVVAHGRSRSAHRGSTGSRGSRAAGIEVTEGVLRDEACEVTLGHVLRVTEGRPAVTLKLRRRQRRSRAARRGRRADLDHRRSRPRPCPSLARPHRRHPGWPRHRGRPTIRASPAGFPAWNAARRCG